VRRCKITAKQFADLSAFGRQVCRTEATRARRSQSSILNQADFLFAVIDPIGSIPDFIAATNGFTEREKRNIAFKAVVVSALILLFLL
jgi:hypothetical protein